MLIVRVNYNEEFFNVQMYPKLKEFYFLSVVPEIVESTYEKDDKDFKEWIIDESVLMYKI